MTFSGIKSYKNESQDPYLTTMLNNLGDQVILRQKLKSSQNTLKSRLDQIVYKLTKRLKNFIAELPGKLKNLITREPALNLYSEEKTFLAKVESVKSIYPPKSDPKESQFFEITLDLSDSHYVSNKSLDQHVKLYPGHHIALTPKDEKVSEQYTRWYSIGPRTNKAVKLLISRVPLGTIADRNPGQFSMSNHLAGLKSGDKVQVYGPHSNQKLETHKPSDNIIMISAGVALVSHLGAVQDRKKQHDNMKQRDKMGKTWLLTGYRTPEHALHHEELKSYPFLNYQIATSRKDPKEYVDQLTEKYAAEILPLLYQDNTYIHICGFEKMGDNIATALIRSAEKITPAKEGPHRAHMLRQRIQHLKEQGRWTEDWGR